VPFVQTELNKLWGNYGEIMTVNGKIMVTVVFKFFLKTE